MPITVWVFPFCTNGTFDPDRAERCAASIDCQHINGVSGFTGFCCRDFRAGRTTYSSGDVAMAVSRVEQ
jgi:hypothetical protein